MFALWGARVEAGEELFTPGNAEEEIFVATLKRFLAERPGYLTEPVKAIKGVSEETTTGVYRLYERAKKDKLPFPRTATRRVGKAGVRTSSSRQATMAPKNTQQNTTYTKTKT